VILPDVNVRWMLSHAQRQGPDKKCQAGGARDSQLLKSNLQKPAAGAPIQSQRKGAQAPWQLYSL
jgi:hypothetical protein